MPGGLCVFRALCGQGALKVLGSETRFGVGGMFFRAGPHPSLDVATFASV
jgi:hypothetical protein